MAKLKANELTADVLVIGAGPGGYAAAFRAADLGKKVICVDAQPLPGGVCLHVGCIPSKALLHIAKIIRDAEEAAAVGISFDKPRLDMDKIRQWKNGILSGQASGVSMLAKSRNVQMIIGRAVFQDSNLARVDGAKPAVIRFTDAILATGSRPAAIPGLDLESDRLWTSSQALELSEIPGKLLVVGGGYIGLELGTVYAALGSKVTVVEMTDGLLPGVDRDLVRPLEQRMKRILANVHLNTKITQLKETSRGISASLEGAVTGKQIFDTVLVSVGRKPNSSGNGLDNTKVTIDNRGFVQVDDQQRTSDPHIFAIGDVAGEPMLAHKAHYEAKVAAEVIAGREVRNEARAIPAVVFTDPEVAWCGMTEMTAREQGLDVQVDRFQWMASGRAATLDRTDGVTKIISDPKNGRVLGVGICGAGAGELIAEGTLAVELGALVQDLEMTIHPHPTLTETIAEAASVTLGNAIHYYTKKKRTKAV